MKCVKMLQLALYELLYTANLKYAETCIAHSHWLVQLKFDDWNVVR